MTKPPTNAHEKRKESILLRATSAASVEATDVWRSKRAGPLLLLQLLLALLDNKLL